MSDLDARVRSFVVELLDDPPEPPPFPYPGVVVITGDHSQRRKRMIDTKTKQEIDPQQRKRWLGPAVAAATFAVIVILVGAIFAINNAADDMAPVADAGVDQSTTGAPVETEAPTVVIDAGNLAAALPGRWDSVDGRAASRPDVLVFGEDGTYAVIDQLRTVDTGVYSVEGDVIAFEADPTDEVLWIFNDMFLRTPRSCEGMIGEYRMVVTEQSRLTLEAVWDECEPRITYANGLVLTPATP